MSDGSTARGWVDDPATFAAALDDLKSTGCLLLVLEAGGSDAGGAGCRRLLGSGDEERKRLLVRSETDTHTTSSSPAGDDPDERTVVYRSTARDAAAAAPPSPSLPATTVASDVDALGDAVEDEVDSLAPLGGYESGQLRVCMDALGTLLEDDDLLSVLEFTKTLGTAVREHDGIAHVHVGQHVPGIAVEGLLGQFDAVVEVGGDDDPRQRWHLPDESLSTRWLEL
ncbi:DUF7504 family protein [Halobacterium noricense]|uniref:DUF7504 family protein n=1 Tax=Halobacterium noricense TaxID=223182 RepID=UPI001E5BF7FE|nr:hypothetical protein [Halobacterium noricense]UHH26380.1 hypothetical protein LT974_05435 [Halobacterium noricense]